MYKIGIIYLLKLERRQLLFPPWPLWRALSVTVGVISDSLYVGVYLAIESKNFTFHWGKLSVVWCRHWYHFCKNEIHVIVSNDKKSSQITSQFFQLVVSINSDPRCSLKKLLSSLSCDFRRSGFWSQRVIGLLVLVFQLKTNLHLPPSPLISNKLFHKLFSLCHEYLMPSP